MNKVLGAVICGALMVAAILFVVALLLVKVLWAWIEMAIEKGTTGVIEKGTTWAQKERGNPQRSALPRGGEPHKRVASISWFASSFPGSSSVGSCCL